MPKNRDIKVLPKSTGEIDALKQKRNFGRCPHQRRLDREAEALAIVKAIRKSPGEPERAAPLRATHLPGTDPNAPGVIYFVYSCGRIKIGYTSELASRMSQFGTHSPMPPVLLLTIPANEADESTYHEMFADDRAHREWFRLSYDLREFLDSKFEPDARALLLEAEYDFLEMTNEGRDFIADVFSSVEKGMRNANRSN